MTTPRRFGVLTLMVVFLPLDLAGQDLPLFRPVPELGLSHQTVFAIQQDVEGFLWFGTGDGLNRYDGYDVAIFRHDPLDETTLSGNLVTILAPGQGGRFWVGTDNGVSWYDPRTSRFRRVRFPGFEGNRDVISLLEGPKGFLWVALSESSWVVNPADLTAQRLLTGGHNGRKDIRLRALQVGSGDSVWLEPEDPDSPPFQASIEPESLEVRIVPSPIIGAHPPAPICGPDRETDFRLVLPSHLPRAVASRRLPPRLEAVDGRTWVGTQNGLVSCDSRGFERQSIAGEDGYLSNFVVSLFRDQDGTFWVGTYNGLFRHDPYVKPFRHYLPAPAEGREPSEAPSAAVSALLVEDPHTVWVGTFGRGLIHWDPLNQATREFRTREGDPESICSDVVWSMSQASDGRLWLGTPQGLCSLDQSGSRFRSHNLPVDSAGHQLNIRSMTFDSADGLWLASTQGLYEFDRSLSASRRVMESGAGPLGKPLESILFDPSGRLWIGTADSQLFSFDLETQRTEGVELKQGLSTGRGQGIWALAKSDQYLWIGSGLGLSRYSTDSGQMDHFGVRDGLPGSVAYSVVPDSSGRLWIGTNQGLSLLDHPTSATVRFTNFGRADGVRNREFNRRAAVASEDGTVFIGGLEGVTFFDSGRIRRNPRPPRIALTSVEVESRFGVRSVNPFQLGAFTLDPDDHAVTMEFAALSFTSPARNRYRYQLEGLDPDWVEAGTLRSVRYAGLSPGTYVFRVRASNGEGVWNEEGRSVVLTVLPPFWRTLWFQLLAVALASLAGVSVYRYRVTRLLEMERLRLRVAEDLHDDLGSNLSGVALLGEGLLRGGDLKDRQHRQVHRITASARQMVEDLRDIVWMVDPKQDTLADLVTRMRDVARDLLSETEYSFTAPPTGSTENLGMETRRQLFLIFKEAVHNVSRHASSQKVAIVLIREGDSLVLEVTDDGRGFDEEAGGGHGLRSMVRRAERLGARLEIESAEGHGTRVVLRTKIA